ncbi:hypothetical protein N7451_000841 [Penicillium sp. IBT 35674x]|nr:hypothetical protein N7451_000841 [Penicillium sp. IBT 35674x]
MSWNVLAIHMNESEYNEPEGFMPERFMGNKFGCKNQNDPDDHRRVIYNLGADRRVCPDQRLAENSVGNLEKAKEFSARYKE